jgi:hypothetical protein
MLPYSQSYSPDDLLTFQRPSTLPPGRRQRQGRCSRALSRSRAAGAVRSGPESRPQTRTARKKPDARSQTREAGLFRQSPASSAHGAEPPARSQKPDFFGKVRLLLRMAPATGQKPEAGLFRQSPASSAHGASHRPEAKHRTPEAGLFRQSPASSGLTPWRPAPPARRFPPDPAPTPGCCARTPGDRSLECIHWPTISRASRPASCSSVGGAPAPEPRPRQPQPAARAAKRRPQPPGWPARRSASRPSAHPPSR